MCLNRSVIRCVICSLQQAIVARTADLQSALRQIDPRPGRRGCVTTLGKLFTPVCPCHQAVFGTGVTHHAMPCPGPRAHAGVCLAERYRSGDQHYEVGGLRWVQLHKFDLFRTCRTSSFCTIAWHLARFQLTRCIARSLGDSGASCKKLNNKT